MSTFKTSTGGLIWTGSGIYSINTTLEGRLLTSIQVLSPNTVYTSTADGRVFRTTNNGDRWYEINVPGHFNSSIGTKLYFFNSLEGYAYSNHGYYFKTIDGVIHGKVQFS
ncbi:MAG TPA: hypothetical protein VEC36_00445 [Patescibacteria group bacterium]|nr:hypothetical protein [Patescibacteria group bacterium]